MRHFALALAVSSAAFTRANPITNPDGGDTTRLNSIHVVPTSSHHSSAIQTSEPPQNNGYNHPPSEQASFTFDELWNLQKAFLDNFMYPANVKQAQMINSSLLAPNAKGRVDLTRTFDGPELNTEYLFGLFSNLALNPEVVTLLGYPTNYSIVHFAANQNIASASSIIHFTFPSLNLSIPLEIDTWNMWNKDGQILQYDATFRWFQYLFDSLIQAAMKAFKVPTKTAMITRFHSLIAEGVCKTHQNHCNGTNTQYDSYESCFNFLTNTTRFGEPYELGADTIVCRMVHENMVPFRPGVHCPHIGPTGGGKCTDDYTYFSKVLEPFFTNAPFVPYGYHDPNSTIAAM